VHSTEAARWWGLAISAAAGIGAVVAVYATVEAGAGAFLVVAAIAGLVAGFAAPSRFGYACLAGSITLAVLVPAAFREFAGLWPLLIGAMLFPGTSGWLVGYALVRGYHLGFRAAVRDRRVLGALVTVLAIVLVIAYVAATPMTDPP